MDGWIIYSPGGRSHPYPASVDVDADAKWAPADQRILTGLICSDVLFSLFLTAERLLVVEMMVKKMVLVVRSLSRSLDRSHRISMRVGERERREKRREETECRVVDNRR